jgi:hypothetical protein
MFTTPCFIRKNTSELRKKLEELGYISHIYNNNDTNNIYVDKLGTYISVDIETQPYFIDCGENEELFLALVALRDDNDYMQWFVSQTEKDSPKIFIKSTTNSCSQSLAYTHRWDWRCSKATVEELIEHFK